MTMRRAALAFLLACVVVGAQAVLPSPAASESARRPYMDAARTTFSGLSPTDRIALHFMLIATGDFNAMVSDAFGGRLYDAIASFQRGHGLAPTGIPDPDTLARLQATGGKIFLGWNVHFVDHPSVEAALAVPGGFGLKTTPSQRGLVFENDDHSFSVYFSYFPAGDLSMADIFDRLSTPKPDRRIDMRVIKDNFFAVAGGGNSYGTYSRFIPAEGGTVGFTASWDTTAYPAGNRVAVFMANSLMRGRSKLETPPPAPQPSAPPPPSPVAPPQVASLETPKAVPPKPVTITGSAFFVSDAGDLLTNNHVIKGCDTATVTGRGTARIVAKDAKNDLALLRLDAKPAAPLTPAVFRTTPLQLGEAVYVLGFPYAGALDNGVNFTNGLVSSVAGMDNDTTEFQMTAAVQPGNSGGPVLDAAGKLLGVTVARMNDVAVLVATASVPQSVNFGIKGEVAASFLRVNGVEPKSSTDAAPLPPPQIAASGKAFTAQVMCVRVGGAE